MLRRTIVLALLPLVACPEFGRAQGAEFGRLASYVSRDAMLFVQMRDVRAFVRRVQHTALGKAIATLDSEDLNQSAVDTLAELAILVPEGALSSLGAILPFVDGEAVLAVEGMSSVDGTAAPEIVAIVERRERLDQLTKLAKLAASGDEDAIDDLEDFDFPFEIDGAAGAVGISKYGDAELFTLLTDRGQRIPIAVTPKLVLAASSDEVLRRAIDRGSAAAFGSLVDSLRFRESARNVEIGPGSVLAYLNLRRVRSDGALLIGRVEWPRKLYGDWLEDFDGICLSLRGTGDTIRACIELEQGRVTVGRASGSGNESMRFPTALPATPFVATIPTSPRMLASAMEFGLYLSGNFNAEKAIDQFSMRVGGAVVFDRILGCLGSEASLFLIGQAKETDVFPRLAMRVDVRDRTALLRTLDALVANSDGRIRSGAFEGEPLYLAEVAGTSFRSHCAVLVRAKEMILVPNPSLLKVLVAVQKSGPPMLEHDPYLAGCDRLDIDPLIPSSSQMFIDIAGLAEVLPQWIEPMFASQRRASAASRLGVELFHAVQDPDFASELSSIYLRAHSTASGVRIEVVGP